MYVYGFQIKSSFLRPRQTPFRPKKAFQFFPIILCDELYENMAHTCDIILYAKFFSMCIFAFFTHLSNAILDGVLYESDIFCYPFAI